MKLFYLLLAGMMVACSSTDADKYVPLKYLSPKELDANLWAMMRYLGRGPDGVPPVDRFSAKYDSTFVAQMKLMTVEAWYKDGDTHFFLVSKRAASLMDKRVATGGKVIFDNSGGIQDYEEVFRTWKMVPDTLERRSMFLFDKMVKGESLMQFETRFSNGVEFIEFPDENTYYDKPERTWKLKPSN